MIFTHLSSAARCRGLKLWVIRMTGLVLAIRSCSASVAVGDNSGNNASEKDWASSEPLTTSIKRSAYSFFCSADMILSSSIVSAIRHKR